MIEDGLCLHDPIPLLLPGRLAGVLRHPVQSRRCLRDPPVGAPEDVFTLRGVGQTPRQNRREPPATARQHQGRATPASHGAQGEPTPTAERHGHADKTDLLGDRLVVVTEGDDYVGPPLGLQRHGDVNASCRLPVASPTPDARHPTSGFEKSGPAKLRQIDAERGLDRRATSSRSRSEAAHQSVRRSRFAEINCRTHLDDTLAVDLPPPCRPLRYGALGGALRGRPGYLPKI